jgi:anti-sigma regulatory factor (Ser/Thr protein kinase)
MLWRELAGSDRLAQVQEGSMHIEKDTKPAPQAGRASSGSRRVRRPRKVLHCKSVAEECRQMVRSAAAFLKEAVTKDAELLYDLELLIMEACANIVLHGYPEKPGDIELHISLMSSNRLSIEVHDWSEPFSGPSEEAFEMNPHKESGRGIFIIDQLADSFAYDRVERKNILRLEKQLLPRVVP